MYAPPPSRRPLLPLAARILLVLCPLSGPVMLGPVPAFGPQAVAAQVAADIERVASVEGITEYGLSNGLTILLFPDGTQSQVTVNVTYMVGSKHEGVGETGMAHLLEHMVFQGTDRHPDIAQEISEHGGRANGTTSFERTNYFQTMPPTEENLAWALDLEADRMVNSWISAEDLESEMTVVRNEWEAGENSPVGVLQKRLLATAFQWHGYGRSPIGERSDIEGVPIDRLQAFYRKYYQPDNAVLIIAGRFDEDQALDMVRETFGSVSRPDRSEPGMTLYPAYTREPVQDGERRVVVRRVGDVQVVMAAYHMPAGSHEDAVAMSLLAHVLGNSPSGRLYQALVETELASSVSVGGLAQRDAGLLLAVAQVRQDRSIEEVERTLVATIDDVLENPPTEEEVERARASGLRSVRLALTNVEALGRSLSEWEALGDWRLLFLNRDRLEETTVADVGRVATAYLLPSNRTLGLFLPEATMPPRAEIPAVPDVEALVADYAGRESLAATDTFDPTPENVEANTTRMTLANGMEVALLPKPTRGEAVVGTMSLRMGSEESLWGRRTPGMLVPFMLSRGTERRTRQEFTDELARLQSTLGVSGNQLGATASFQTTRGNLADVLALLSEMLQEPAFDPQEFETLRRSLLATLESRRSDPGSLGGTELNRRLSPYPEGHPLHVPDNEQQIEWLSAATVDELREFHEDFYGAGPSATLALVGDFDPAEARAALEELFGEWVPATPYERVTRIHSEPDPGEQVIETPDRTNAFFFAGLNLPLDDANRDYPALLMANYLIGGGFLSSRLAERVRQQEGLSYGISSGLVIPPLDEAGSFRIQAISAPENVEAVQAAIREELERVLEEGFTEEETRAGIEGWLQGREVARATDAMLAGTLSNGLFLDRTLLYDAQLEERISRLTAAEVSDAALRYLDLDRLVIVKAGDLGAAGN